MYFLVLFLSFFSLFTNGYPVINPPDSTGVQQEKRIPIYTKYGADNLIITYRTGIVESLRAHNHLSPDKTHKTRETIYKIPDSLSKAERQIILIETRLILPDYEERYIKKFGKYPLDSKRE